MEKEAIDSFTRKLREAKASQDQLEMFENTNQNILASMMTVFIYEQL